MKMPLPIPKLLIQAAIAIFCVPMVNAHAQMAMEAPDTKLSKEEETRLRVIVEAPVDLNSMNLKLIQIYKEKELASFLLKDRKANEQILRDWLKISPADLEPKGKLRDLLWAKGDREASLKLGEECITESKWPSQKVGNRASLAYLYLQERNLAKAKELINKSEEIVKNELPSQSKVGASIFWITLAELGHYMAKSELESIEGKWTQAIESSKIAALKSNDVLKFTSYVKDEDQKNLGKRIYFMAQTQVAMRQTNAGLYSDAEETFRQTYARIKPLGFNENNLPQFLTKIADLYNANAQFAQAIEYSKKTSDILVRTGASKQSISWIESKESLTLALAGLDQWSAALEEIQNLEKIKNDFGSEVKITIQNDLKAFVYLKNNKTEAALEVLKPHLDQQIEFLGEANYLTAISKGLYAVALAQKSDLQNSRMYFEKSKVHLTSPDSISGDYLETAFQKKMKRYILQNYMQLLAKSASANVADAQILFELSDQISTSSVQQALTEAAVRSGINIPGLSDIIRKEQDARNEITSLALYMASQITEVPEKRNPQVVEQMRQRRLVLEAQRKEYKAQIQKGYPEYFQLIQPKSPTHSDIAKQLKDDELFISILPLEDGSYIWAIDSKGKVHFHNAPLRDKEVKTLVANIRKTLDVAELGAKAPTFDFLNSNALYKAFLGPIENELTGKTHLVIATSGALAQIPMAVLTRTPTTAAQSNQANWLIKDFSISHVPSASGWLALKKLGQQPSSSEPLIAWGDPAFDPKAQQLAVAQNSQIVRSAVQLRAVDSAQRTVMDASSYVLYSKLPTLPETRDEVLELAKILSADPSTDVILGKNATRESVLRSNSSGALGKKQVIVFATHGLLAGDLPNLNQPALAMATSSDAKESPLLTLEDVLSLKLNADWVVLSACNTAGADGKAEEALSGLARGFFFAGSRSLLVTHWSVESESAMQLTTHTFAAYKKNPSMRRADALRQAMLEVMKSSNYGHPAYWAPYALVGEGGR
jgi:CHAT domain-containing protein